MIPEGVINIGEEAFGHCTNLSVITIPQSLVSIGKYAFTECSALKALKLTKNITSIGGGAFRSCRLTIYAPAGSYSEEYAKKRGIPFVAE